MTENEKIKKAFTEILDNYDCSYEINDLEALPHDVQMHIAKVYYQRPFDEDNPNTYRISHELDREILKAININDFKKIIGADELSQNGIEITDIKTTSYIGGDFYFDNSMDDDDIQISFREIIKEISFKNSNDESMTFTSYKDLKKAINDPNNSFFHKPKSVQNTPVKNFSSAGAEKLREMTENSDMYIDFLKFQGRVFKHNASVALEFFTQRPETKFIATREQWEKSKRTVAQGSEAIRFVDSDGKNTDFYDFSQVEETTPPYQWTINKSNVNAIKSQLEIPEKMTLISGVINSTVKPAHITSCMSALGIPPKDYKAFSKSYLNAIQLVIAGRLEIGGSTFNFQPDLTALKMLKTESQKLAFLTYAANTARESLMKIERAAQNITTMERIEKNDLREMENTDPDRTEERIGRGTAVNTSRITGEQPDRSESNESGRNTGLGNDTESPEWKEHEMVSGVQNEDSERSGVLVQVQPNMRTLQPESDGIRAVDGGRTDRNLWNEVDDVHGGELSASGGRNEAVSQVSDSSSLGGQERTGIQRFTGRPVRTGESTSDGLRGSAEMGTGEDVLLGQHSNEGNSLSSSDGSIEEKLNSVFSSEETEKTSTEKADVFVLSDEERLIQITAEIGEKEKTFTNLANAKEKDYNLIADVVKEIQEMKKIQIELKEKIQAEPLTKKDVELLFEIEPPKKSVQNMTEPEVAKTIKFESMLDKEMGGKSPYAMRKKGGNNWRNDESKKVKITEVQPHSTSRPEIMSDYRDPDNFLLKDSKYLNPDTGATIFLDKDGISETIAKAMVDKKHSKPYKAPLAALYHIEDLIENSVCFDSQISKYDKNTAKNKSPNTMMMHRFYGVIKYNDDFYLTNMAIEETYKSKDNTEIDSTKNHLYSLRGIKITPIGNLGLIPRSDLSIDKWGSPSSVTEISIPQLYEFVKSLDTNFYENYRAVGREARETELFLQAKHEDAVNNDPNHTETKKQIIEFAKSHNISINEATKNLEELVEIYSQFPADGKTKNDIIKARDSEFAEKVKAAFSKIAEQEDYNEIQAKFMRDVEKFTIANHVSGTPIEAALRMSSQFRYTYINENWIDSSIFNGRLPEIKNALNQEIKMQMELLKQEKAQKSPTEKEKKSTPENTEIDLTDGVSSAPQIQIASSDWKIDMEDIPQIIFLETDNSDGKFHFNETVFTYDIENVAIDVQESFDNLYGFDDKETLSVEEGTSQISELMELYTDKNMHISVTHENGESESLMQYINHASNDYPIIKASLNKQVPEFAESKICTVEEYNDLLAEASKNIPEGQSFKLHFKVILSDKRSYSETFELTRDTGKLSEILTNSENNNKSNRNFLKALKMISEQENRLNMSEAKSDSNNTPEKPPKSRAVSIKRKKEILDDFAKRNGLEKINIWRKSGNPASYRIAESENGNRIFNEQLYILEKGEILSEEKLLKSLEEFEKSDFFIQYQQKKAENQEKTPDESNDEIETQSKQKYPYVSVKAGWNYDKYIAPELETRDYTVPEFNNALKKLSERWNGDEYETKSAFVTLTVHLSETESFEKRLNAEYQFESLSQCLNYDTDWLDSEIELRKAVEEAEKQAKTLELTEKEKAFLSGEITPFMAKSVLSWDEIESIGYIMFEKGYTERYAPRKNSIYGNGLHQPELYDIVKRMHNNEDIRRELTLSLLGNQHTFTTTKGNEFSVEYGEDFLTAKYGNVERQVDYMELGNAFLVLINNEYNDIVHDRTVEDLQYVIPNLSTENADKLISVFDNSIMYNWQNDLQKQQEIKHSLHDVLVDEELTEKAFASIAEMKYNYKPDVKQKQTQGTYKIYQLPDDEKYHGIRFTGMKALENEEIQLNFEDYKLVYEGELSEFKGIDTLKKLYRQFNVEHPEDFTGRSLSVSDVIVTETDGEQNAYYCDTMGFTEMPQFFLEKSLSQENSESKKNNMDFFKETVSERLKNSEYLKSSAISNTPEDFSFTYHEETERILIDMLGENISEPEQALITQLLDNTDLKNGTFQSFMEEIYNDFRKSEPEKSADDLKIGDIIRYDNETWRITDIKGDFSLNLENTDKNSVMPVRSFIGNWKEQLVRDGFEYIPVKDVISQELHETENKSLKPQKDIITKGQMSLLEDISKIYQIVTYSKDSGADDKEDYATINEAIDAGSQYLEDDYYDGYAILNTAEHRIELYSGVFPRDGIFSEEVYENSETYVPTPNNPTSEKLYRRFEKMFPDIVSGEHTYERYGNVGDAYEPLTVEHLGGNTYAFMTYFIQNGDVMRDPDFEFELDHKNKTLNILEYQQDGTVFGTISQRVYDENNNPDLKLLSALEKNFLQNLKNAHNMERPLTSYTDKNGNEFNSDNEPETIEPEEPEINDKSPELRTVLNEFSEKYGLGELNVEPENYSWKLIEKFADGTDFPLGEINSPEYGKPFTSDELRISLEEFEKASDARNQNISEIYSRQSIAERHGGVSELPKVQKNLPEITYASRPSEKISNNISAIREMIRLENAEKSGEELYDKRSNQYNSKQNSEYRLRQYSGWGGLSQVFDERFKQYDYRRQELHSLLTPEEYAEAKASSLNAHYTPQIIIDAMYKAVKNMDLPRDAKILEPACGTGNFISRLPHSFGDAEVTGVELDSITARIAKQINRDNEKVQIINSGFENSGLANNSFDLAIGNVPFGDYNMNDPDYVQDWRIHDAFFRKALDKVASGGVVAFVTSTGTMDKSNPKIREYLATQAELIGAVRLPNNAFSDAGTGVPSDIIFLKKRENPLPAHEPKPDWCYTIPDKNGLKINSYFVQNPQMVLGEMKKTTFQDRLTCEPFEGANLEKQLNEAIKNLNAKITVTKREKAVNEQRGNIEPWGKNFTFQLKDDKVYYRNSSKMEEIKCTKTEKEMIKRLCEIRDVTRKLIDLQKTSVQDSELIPVRESLNKLYDEYRAEHGELFNKSVKRLFGSDSDYPILQSLENYNKETEKVEKADIFFRRTVNPMLEINSVESVEEALQVSLDQKGKPDIPYMAILIDKSPESVCSELLEKGQIFIDPEKELPDKPFSGVVERSEYLSGNVRMKLTIAEEYAKTNPEYNQNVDALKTVIPEDIKADEISVQMGCPWIESEDYTAFLEHLSGRSNNSRSCDVSYSTTTGEFDVLNAGSKKDLNLNETTTYGTSDYNMYQLAEKILNQRRIVVQREKVSPKDPSKTVTRTDPKATKIALEKAKLIRAEFEKWIFADEKRKAKYEHKYNNIFNSIVGRDYDGSHLTFAGMTNDFTLRPHQKNCVARAIYGGNTLAAHVVGAGKSAVIFTSVMKKKELGLINKACVVVPKALTEQTANEWRKVYPDAKILTVTNDDLSNETKRNLFTAKVATGSYDAVILSQEQFEKIPMSKQYRINFMQKELDSLEDMLREKKIENHGKKDYSVKAIEKSKKQLEAKLEKLLNPKSASKAKDDLLEFEQLGFDYLVCDEAHAYKNGFVQTKMTNVAGVTTKPSGRAEDMQMKTDYFNEQLGQGHILFATGTPIAAPYQH